MWIHQLLRSFDRDLDSGLARIRAKTLGISGPKVSIGSGRVRIFKDGKLAGNNTDHIAVAKAKPDTDRIAVVKAKPDSEQTS